MSNFNKAMIVMGLISAFSIAGTISILSSAPPKPSCEERGGKIVMAGAVAVMAGQVAIPVPYYDCVGAMK